MTVETDKRIPGQFVPLCPDMLDDPAIAQAGALAELLYIRGLLHSKRSRSDGVIPKAMLPHLAIGITSAKKQAQRLVDANLWIDQGETWYIRSWPKWNLSAEQQELVRAARKAKSSRAAHSRWHSKEKPSAGCEECRKEGWT
jgi:hypothetical protein